MKQAKMQICLFIVLLAGLTGCGSTAKKAEVTNSPEPSVSYEQGADFVGAVGVVDEEQGTMEFYNTTFQTMETYPYTGGTQILTKNNKEMTASEIELGEVYDVGSGKTVVSMVAAYKAVKSRLSSSNYGANCYFSNTTFRKL